MSSFIKSIKVIGIVLAVVAMFAALEFVSFRKSLFDWMLLSAVLLPVAYLRQWRFMPWAMGAVLVGMALAASPFDFVVQSGSGEFGFRILPVSFGRACKPGYVCYGCTVFRNPPTKALVLQI